MQSQRTPAVFIAGTDTGIGKTHVSVALVHALRAHGLRVAGMKPVASGCEPTPRGLRNEDALALQGASDPRPRYAQVNPVALRAAVSPHLAAAEAGVSVCAESLLAAYRALAADYDGLVVEGVGGWMVPLDEQLLAPQLVQTLDLPVILVVGLRLGCLNHALLSARAILADGCRLLGWVGNAVDAQMDMREANLATLRRLMPAPCLGELAHGEPAEVASRRLGAASAAILAA